MTLTRATVGELDGISQVCSRVDAGRSVACSVVPDQLGIYVNACNIIDDAPDLELSVFKQVPQQSSLACRSNVNMRAKCGLRISSD